MTSANIRQHHVRPIRREAATHLFAVGQAVRLRSGFRGPFRFTGIYHITGTLPPTGDSPQYRIRSDDEPYERVTTQESLQAALLSTDGSATLVEGTFGQGTETQQSRDPEAGAGRSRRKTEGVWRPSNRLTANAREGKNRRR